MNDEPKQRIVRSPGHDRLRRWLRVAGPLVAMAGIALTVGGMISFFLEVSSFERPRFFWCVFVGLPVLFAGVTMCQFGYLGSVLRYFVRETAPVAKDTVNYMARETREGVKTTAKAIAEGVKEGMTAAEETQKKEP